MSAPVCYVCGRVCSDLNGQEVIRSNEREWICEECLKKKKEAIDNAHSN